MNEITVELLEDYVRTIVGLKLLEKGKDPKGGLNRKGVASYRKANPGSKLQTAVTTPPSQLKVGSKKAKRRKSFCARSKNWKSKRGLAARRRWNC